MKPVTPFACAKKQPLHGAARLVIAEAEKLVRAATVFAEQALTLEKRTETASSEAIKKTSADLYQAACALDCIGLDGIAAFPQLMRSALLAISENNTDQVAELLVCVAQGGRVLLRYLQATRLGYVKPPIRLLASYRALYGQLKKEHAPASDLLSVVIQETDAAGLVIPEPDTASAAGLIKPGDNLRIQYEQALLIYLTAPETSERKRAAIKIAAIIGEIMQQQQRVVQRAHWYLLWVYAQCAVSEQITDLVGTKKIFAGVGRQIRHLADTHPPFLPKQLLQVALFEIAGLQPSSAVVDQIVAIFNLHAQVPADYLDEDAQFRIDHTDVTVTENFSALLSEIRVTIDAQAQVEIQQSVLSPLFDKLASAAVEKFSLFAKSLSALRIQLAEQSITQQHMLMLAAWLILLEQGLANEVTAQAWLEQEKTLLADALDHIIRRADCADSERACYRAAMQLNQEATAQALVMAILQSLSSAERKIEELAQSDQGSEVAAALTPVLMQLIGVSAFLGESSIIKDLQSISAVLHELAPSAVKPDAQHYQDLALQFVQLMQQVEKISWVQADIYYPLQEEVLELAELKPEEAEFSPSPALHAIYDNESRGLIAQLDQLVRLWLAAPDHVLPQAAVHAAHSLAGSSATVGLTAVQELAAMLESVLSAIANTGTARPDLQYDILLETILTISRMLEKLREDGIPDAQPTLVQALGKLRQQLEHPPVVSAAVAEVNEVFQPHTAAANHIALNNIAPPVQMDLELRALFMLEAEDLLPDLSCQMRALQDQQDKSVPAAELLRILHTLKGSARMAGAGELGDVLHEMEYAVNQFAQHTTDEPLAIEKLFAQLDQAMHLFSLLETENSRPAQEAAQVQAQAQAQARPVQDNSAASIVQLRVRSDLLERISSSAAELAVGGARVTNEFQLQRQAITDLGENINRLRSQLRELEIQAETRIASQLKINGMQDFDPLEFDRYTSLQELTRMMTESLGDIVSVQRTLARYVDDAELAISVQTRHARNLQTDLRRVRIVQFSSMAERLHHLVRQTARELDKEVRLEIQGGSIELDRSMLEKISAPLEHLLRNAIVHGIESAAEREQAGKPVTGNIIIALAQQGNDIVIQFSDDGCGLDLARIRNKAISAGLLQAEFTYAESELAALIFEPGLSTADQVTAVAGRGIGMDVVRATVLAQGGALDISTRPGMGVTFKINLPLIQATAQVVLVHIGDRLVALPSSMVEHVLQLPAAQAVMARQAGTVTWRDKTVPLHHLSRLLGEMPTAAHVGASAPPVQIVILRGIDDLFAIELDAIHGNREVVVKNIGPQLAQVAGISGATVLADGRVVLILNPLALIESALRQQRNLNRNSLDIAGGKHAPVLPVVLVVDDSLTVRRVSQRMLERCGYAVVLARDGMEALEKLQTISPDVVLLDIEMPRMDGFELLRKIRQEPHTHKLPVVMITSRSAEKHREHAFRLGATDYLGKPFNETELLALLKQLCDKEKNLQVDISEQ